MRRVNPGEILQKGQQILYIPSHVDPDGKWSYLDGVQPGFVMKGPVKGFGNDRVYFCRYFVTRGKNMAPWPELRTKANSEATSECNIFPAFNVPQVHVDELIQKIEEELK